MAWIFLAESGVLQLPWGPGSAQLPIVRTIDTLSAFCSPECETGNCHGPRSGMMCERSPVASLHALTLSTAGSPARTSALQELEQAWLESEAASSSKSSDSLAHFDLDSFSWRTSQQSLFGGLTEFSWSSLRFGTIVDGRLYQPLKLEPHTSVSDGSFLPTPTAADYGSNNHGVKEGKSQSKSSLGQMARKNLWPTPIASRGDYQMKKGVMTHLTLSGAAKKWPTPTASMVTMSDMEQARFSGSSGDRPSYKDAGAGSLNPTWVEWLMGYPLEWTVLEGWAMQWFRSKRAKRSCVYRV